MARAAALLVVALLHLVPCLGARAGDDSGDPDHWVEVAQRARPSIVRIQWRPGGGLGEPVERHAVILDPNGWLLMAGPPGDHGSLAATLDDGRSMRAAVYATDAATGLTLLRIPATRLPSLGIHSTSARHPDGTPRQAPHRIPPGTRVMMVTAEGAVATGQIRANHRIRMIKDPLLGKRRRLTCLDEAGLAVLATDLGAPWLDVKGRVAGLMVGADLSVAPALEGNEIRFRPHIVAAYAVPARVLQIVWPLLRDRGEVPRGMLGIRTRPLDHALMAHVCPDCGGRVVTAVAPKSPATLAGIREGDILRGIGGALLAPDTILSDALLPYRPKQEVLLSLLREGKSLDLVVRLGISR